MEIELVVTADTSAPKSYVEVLGPNDVTAAGELTFYIIPVRALCMCGVCAA
jgi:hypothetical protein